MQGKRVYPQAKKNFGFDKGDYGFVEGIWYACTPNGLFGNLSNHEVIEHEDGTITVSPSILVTGEGEWHGYLERGVWREV